MANEYERFWSKVIITTPDKCWEWTGATVPAGYGSFWDGTRNLPAHRFSAIIANNRTLESSQVVCHTCDNRKCVNPHHLVIADHKWNAQDREAKGRGADANKTHCPAGHAYTDDNTYIIPASGARQCRECRRQRDKARRESGVRREADRLYQRKRYYALRGDR